MSTNPRIYLDFNATAPLVPAAREAMAAAMGVVGNPSSVHAEGRAARDLVEQARNRVATLSGRPREQVVFTSGGTEANGLGVAQLAAEAERRGLPRVIASAGTDHPSLHGAVAALVARGWVHRALGADLTGVGVIAMTAVNHELGTVADLPVHRGGALLHVDAVQAAGKLPLERIGADSIAISAHKLGGPQGAGAWISSIDPGPGGDQAVDAGHQERGRRAGTENTIGIVGFGAAAAAIELAAWPGVAALGERLEAGLRTIVGARINGAELPRIGGTINAAFAGVRGESIVMALDLTGISVSNGAACTSGSVKPSPVLLAIGQTATQAREAVRFSLGRTTTTAEIDAVLKVLPSLVERAHAHSSGT
ncbi:aminotransferase class V-fold PLP-dependent enzyme [soil metagenome]